MTAVQWARSAHDAYARIASKGFTQADVNSVAEAPEWTGPSDQRADVQKHVGRGLEVLVGERYREPIVIGVRIRTEPTETDRTLSRVAAKGVTGGMPKSRGGAGKRGPRTWPDLIKAIEDTRGWRLDRHRGSGHYVAYGPKGAMVTFAATPSDYKALDNTIGDLRRAGLDLT